MQQIINHEIIFSLPMKTKQIKITQLPLLTNYFVERTFEFCYETRHFINRC